jgi:hypothetical protein
MSNDPKSLKDITDARLAAAAAAASQAEAAAHKATITAHVALGSNKTVGFEFPADFDLVDFTFFMEAAAVVGRNLAHRNLRDEVEQDQQQPAILLARGLPGGVRQ